MDSKIHADLMASNLKGAPQPSIMKLAAQIHAENKAIGMGGAMQRATEVQRKWAVENGFVA